MCSWQKIYYMYTKSYFQTWWRIYSRRIYSLGYRKIHYVAVGACMWMCNINSCWSDHIYMYPLVTYLPSLNTGVICSLPYLYLQNQMHTCVTVQGKLVSAGTSTLIIDHTNSDLIIHTQVDNFNFTCMNWLELVRKLLNISRNGCTNK